MTNNGYLYRHTIFDRNFGLKLLSEVPSTKIDEDELNSIQLPSLDFRKIHISADKKAEFQIDQYQGTIKTASWITTCVRASSISNKFLLYLSLEHMEWFVIETKDTAVWLITLWQKLNDLMIGQDMGLMKIDKSELLVFEENEDDYRAYIIDTADSKLDGKRSTVKRVLLESFGVEKTSSKCCRVVLREKLNDNTKESVYWFEAIDPEDKIIMQPFFQSTNKFLGWVSDSNIEPQEPQFNYMIFKLYNALLQRLENDGWIFTEQYGEKWWEKKYCKK